MGDGSDKEVVGLNTRVDFGSYEELNLGRRRRETRRYYRCFLR